MSARKIRVGAWELRHHVLRPSRCLLQTHSQRLQQAIIPPLDPIITFRLTAHPPTPHSPPKDDTPRTVAIHRSLLRAAGGPLKALVTAPFAEAEMSEIVIHETFECFDVVRRLLYCEPIQMLNLPSDLPLVADRWGLHTLFEACFTHAEERAHAHAGVPKLSVAELIIKYVPIMAIVDVPDRFKAYMALRLGIEIKTVDAYFKKHPVTPTSMDDICCVEHDDSVTCRRRRAIVCAGKDQQPCTHIENACPESPSISGTEETAEKEALPEGDAEIQKADDAVQSPAISVSNTSPSTSVTSVDPQSGEVIKDSSEPLEQPPSSPEEPSTAEESASAPNASTSGNGSSDTAVDSTDVGGTEIGGTEQQHAESTDGAATDGAATDVAAAAADGADGDVQSAVTVDANGDAAPSDQSTPAPVATSTNADPSPADTNNGPSESAEQATPSEEESSVHGGSISDMSAPEDNSREGDEASDAEKEDNQEEKEEESEEEDLQTSEAPQHSDWHDNFNVWQIFQTRNMLHQVIHYLSHYGPGDYTPLVLDVVLRQLESKLSDEEITKLLREIDWDWENPSCQALNSKSAESWSARAWRLLACARVGFTGAGSDIRMSWNYSDLFRDMHARATELANRSNNDSDSDTSHSSVDDQTDFTVDWDEKAGDEHFEFSMSLRCDCMALEHLSELKIRIHLIEKDDAPLDKQNGRREVSARIKVIESGCGCDLPYAPTERDYQGFTANPGVKRNDSRTTLWAYKDNAVDHRVMCSDDLGSWMKRHRKQCGLVFKVRIYVYPLEDDEGEKKKPARKGDQNKNECTCGFCECDACSVEEHQEDQEDQEEN